MAYNSKRFFAHFFLLMNIPLSLMAAEVELKEGDSVDPVSEENPSQQPSFQQMRAELVGQISMTLAGFNMIDPNKLASIALTKPEAGDVAFGLDQIKNCLAILGADFDKSKEFKLSFDLPMAELKNFVDMSKDRQAAENQFRLAPLPHQMADYLNQQFGPKRARNIAQLGPKKLKAYAVSHSLLQQAGFAAFQTDVVANIEGMAPILAYSPVANNNYLRFDIIVGFQKNDDGFLENIAIFTSEGQPAERIKIVKATTFFKDMTASQVKEAANGVVSVLENKKNKKAAVGLTQRPSTNDLKLMGTHSYICFIKPSENLVRGKLRLPSLSF